MRLRGLALTAMVVGGALVGCSDDGRELAEPDPDLTLTSPPTTAAPAATTVAPTAGPNLTPGAGGFSISSPEIEPGKPIPRRFTCDGEDVSPPLSFAFPPEGTAQLAVIVTDPDADNFVHWAVRGISPSTAALGEGELPDQAAELTNGFGVQGYRGPCPPGNENHRYVFTAYALDANVVELPIDANGVASPAQADDLALAKASFDAEFARSG